MTLSRSKYSDSILSENTNLAYQHDIEGYKLFGFELPASESEIVRFMEYAALRFNPRTILRKITAIRYWHKNNDYADPTQSTVVLKTMRGIERKHGRPKKQAIALRIHELDQISEFLLNSDRLIDIRNRALILLGFFGAFRRNELANMKWGDIEIASDGLVIHLNRSKTDQRGEGQRVVIPYGDLKNCPVRALLNWRRASEKFSGYVFRRISKFSTLSEKSISAHQINRIIQEVIKEVGLPNAKDYSAHSLRRGFATEASRLGAPIASIQRHGRWKSINTVLEYIEAGRQFSDNALNVFLDRNLM
jgi:integrase